MRGLAVSAAVASLLLVAVVVRHYNAHSPSELLQGPDFADKRRAAVEELSAQRMNRAVEEAYERGFKQGETAEEQAAPHQGHPALLGASKRMMLARLRAQQQEEATLDARKEVHAERNVAMALDAEEASEPRAFKVWQSGAGANQEKFGAERMSLAMAAANKQEPSAYKRMSLAMAMANKQEPAAYDRMKAAMGAEERAEPRAYKAWESMGGGNQEAEAAKSMSLAVAQANKEEPAAYDRMKMAMGAEERAEPRAYKAWDSMGGSRHEKYAAQRMSLAMAAANGEEPAAYRRMQLAMKEEEREEPEAYRRTKAAMAAEERAEPAALKAWENTKGGQQLAAVRTSSLAEQRKMELASLAEEALEPMAYERFENSREERAKRAMAEARLQRMHSSIEQGLKATSEQERAVGEAAKLFDFCSKEFAGNAVLSKFCFERLSSPPQDAKLSQSLTPVEFTGHSLQAAIERAHAAGIEGMPKYAVLHTQEGPEAFKLIRVSHGGSIPHGAVGFVNMPDVPHQTRLVEARGPVKVDAPTLKAAIEKAHAEGLRGEPKYVVFHPAQGEPQVFKLMGSEA